MSKIKELKTKIDKFDRELDNLRIKVVMSQFNQNAGCNNLEQKREKIVQKRNCFVKQLLEEQDRQASKIKKANKERRREEAES